MENYFEGQAQTTEENTNPPGVRPSNGAGLSSYALPVDNSRSLGEKLEEFIKNVGKRLPSDYRVVVLKDSQLMAPTVFAVSGSTAFGFLIEEATKRPLTTRVKEENGNLVERNEVACDIVDANYKKVADKFLQAKFGKAITVNGIAVLPKSAQLDSESTISFCCAYAQMGVVGYHTKATAKGIAAENYVVVNTFNFKPNSTTVNELGVPLATDFTIRTAARQKTNKAKLSDSMNFDNNEVLLANVNGRIDALYHPQNNSFANNDIIFGGSNRPQPGYVGLVVLNSINGLDSSASRETLLTQLIGIASAARLAANQNWQRVYQPTPGEVNTKPNPGLVALEHNVFGDANYEPQELKVHHGLSKPGSDEMSLQQLFSSYFYKTGLVVLEIEKNSPNAFVQNIFFKAATGDEAALKEIVDTLNHFSDNNFSKHFRSKDIAATKPTFVHSGYFLGDDSQTRVDLGSIDHMSKLAAYSDPLDIYHLTPDPKRASFGDLYKTWSLLKGLAPSATQTGWKIQIMFKPAFVQAIVKCMDDAGLKIGTENLDNNDKGIIMNDSLNSILDDLNSTLDLGDLFSNSLDLGDSTKSSMFDITSSLL